MDNEPNCPTIPYYRGWWDEWARKKIEAYAELEKEQIEEFTRTHQPDQETPHE